MFGNCVYTSIYKNLPLFFLGLYSINTLTTGQALFKKKKKKKKKKKISTDKEAQPAIKYLNY